MNFIEDVLQNGGFGINIILGKLKELLGLAKPKPTPYNLPMANQTIVKPLGLIKDLKIFVHRILIQSPLRQNNVLDSGYFILLSHPWLKNAKVFRD
jgi:hypothetical protein